MLEFLEAPLAVDEEDAAGLHITGNGEALQDVGRNVAGNKVSLVDIVRALDGLVAKAQMADGDTAGLLGVILEVGLNILVGMVADDLAGVLVGADSTVTAETPEFAFDGASGRGGRSLGLFEREVGHIIDNADGELALHLCLLQLVVNSEDGSRRSILGTEAVAAADDSDVILAGIGQSSDNIEIERLALCTGFLGTVENGDLLGGCGDGFDELVRAERTEQTDLHKTDFFALSGEIVNHFFCNVADGAHCYDDAVGIGSAIVVEEGVIGTELLVDLAHVLFYNCGDCFIVGVGRLAILEENVPIFMRAAHDRVIRVQSACTELFHSLHVDQIGEIFVIPDLDLLDFVGGAETVEEVEERHSALDGCEVCNRAEVHDFLNVGLAQHGETCLAAGHDVRMVTEDAEGVGCEGTGGYMKDTGEKFAGDLVHVRNHQQKTLGCGVGRREGACIQAAVNSTCCTGFCLHFLHFNSAAEKILSACCGPLIHIVSHRAGRGDRVDCCYFCECVGNMSGSVVAVHRFEVTLNHSFVHLH